MQTKAPQIKTLMKMLPEEVYIREVGVLGLSGVPSRKGAEESIGEQTCRLLLRHGDGVIHASFQERYRLEEEQRHS